jgi:hypothetical protein
MKSSEYSVILHKSDDGILYLPQADFHQPTNEGGRLLETSASSPSTSRAPRTMQHRFSLFCSRD